MTAFIASIIYYFGAVQLLLLWLFAFKTKTYYEESNRHISRFHKSVIIISNHRSFMDGILIALRFFFNRMHFMVTDFYGQKRKLLKLVVRVAGGVLVSGKSVRFMKESKKIAAKGRPLLIFPEGGFQDTYEPQKFIPGYVMLAVKLGVPIVPIVNDFNYGLFKRVNILIGNSIDLSCYAGERLTKSKLNEINDVIYAKYVTLFYKLKKIKAERFSMCFCATMPKKGDVIRVQSDIGYQFGVYLRNEEVVRFGYAKNQNQENAVVHTVSLDDFCEGQCPEVRIFKRCEKRFLRDPRDIEKYAKSCLGQGGYSDADSNDFDFANRVTLKI